MKYISILTLLSLVHNSVQVATVKKLLLLFTIALSLMACQSGPKLDITSSIPARIEKGGITVCSSTPCIVSGDHYVDGYELGCVSAGDSKLEAFPLDPSSGYKQSKTVRADCNTTPSVYFDMGSGGVINTIQQPSGNNQEVLIKKLETLNDLRKRGLITDSDFKQKKKELLNEFK